MTNQTIIEAGNYTAQQQFSTHYDVIEFCYTQICEAFSDLGGIAPSISDLASFFGKFAYCETENKTLHKKVGYIINLGWHNHLPTFLLTVHSFKGGKTTRVVSSGSIIAPYLAELQNKPELAQALRAKSLEARQARQLEMEQAKQKALEKARADALERQQRFEEIDHLWHRSSTEGIYSHPYIFAKKITELGEMRLIDAERIAYPLRNIELQIVGYQIIYANGFKVVYGKDQNATKGAFGILCGDINSRTVFVCEGFATADKVVKLKHANHKNALVLCTINAGNLPQVVKAIKLKRVANKSAFQFHIVADNDHIKCAEGKGNTGIRFAMEARMIAGAKAALYIPKFDESESGTDWDDKWRSDKMLAKAEFKAETFSNFTALIAKLKALPVDMTPRQVFFSVAKAIRASIELYPTQLSKSDIIDQVYAACQHTGYAKATVEKLVAKYTQQRTEMALRVSSISHDTDGVDYIAFDEIDEAKSFIDDIKAENKDNGVVVLLKAPMGSGKTQVILKSIVAEAEEAGKFPTAVAPVKSLVKACANTFGISHYLDDGNEDFEATNRHGKVHSAIATGLAVTINSLPNEKFKTFASRSSVFVVDEISQVIRAITQGTVKQHMRQKTERALAAMLNKAELSILADADLNQIVVDYVREVTKEDVKVYVVEVEPKPLSHLNYNVYVDTDTELNHAQNIAKLQLDLAGGKNIYCVSDSKLKTEQLLEAASEVVNSAKCLVINSDTTYGKNEAAFLANANQYVKDHKPRLIIASPSVQSGLSIEVDHFHVGYGFATATVTPTYLAQMLHRVRNLTQFNIALPCPTIKYNSDLENPEFIYFQSIKHHTEQFFIDKEFNNPNDSIQITDAGIQLHEEMRPYCRLSAELTALDNQQRHNFSNFFVIQALEKGIRVNINDKPINDDDKKQLKKTAKTYHKAAKDNQVSQVVGINAMTEDEYTTLKKYNQLSQAQQHEIKRYEVAQATGKSEITEADVKFYQDNGLLHVKTYEALQLGQEHAHQQDQEDIDNGVAIVDENWQADKVILTALILNTLGIDSVNLTGEYSEKEAKALMCQILLNDNLIRFIKLKFKINLKQGYVPIKLANLLLKRLFGIKAIRAKRSNYGDRKQYYALDSEQVEQLLKYVHNRAEIKKLYLNNMGVAA